MHLVHGMLCRAAVWSAVPVGSVPMSDPEDMISASLIVANMIICEITQL